MAKRRLDFYIVHHVDDKPETPENAKYNDWCFVERHRIMNMVIEMDAKLQTMIPRSVEWIAWKANITTTRNSIPDYSWNK